MQDSWEEIDMEMIHHETSIKDLDDYSINDFFDSFIQGSFTSSYPFPYQPIRRLDLLLSFFSIHLETFSIAYQVRLEDIIFEYLNIDV